MPLRCNADVKASYEHPRGVCETDAVLVIAMPQRGENGDILAYCEKHAEESLDGLRATTPSGAIANVQAVLTLICQDVVRRVTESESN